jgi:uncharacterized protein
MGRVVHFEIPSDDPQKSVEFYSKTFGWKCQKWGEMEYWLADTGQTGDNGINGAIIKRQTHFQTIINTINVGNIEESLEAITRNGGKVLTPVMPLPNIGKIAYFTDPQGNTLGLIEDEKK